MPEINLLPDEFRKKEQKELASARKKPKVVKIGMSTPETDRTQQPLRDPKPSLMSRLFAKKETPAKPLAPEQEAASQKVDLEGERAEKREFHIPKVGGSSGGGEKSFSTGSGITNAPAPERQEVSSGGSSESSSSAKSFSAAPKDSVSVKRVSVDGGGEKSSSKKSGGLFGLFGRKKKKMKAISGDDSSSASDDGMSPGREGRHGRRDSKKEASFGGGLDINLIPEDLARYPEVEFPKKVTSTVLSIVIVMLLLGGAYLGLVWYQFNVTQQIEGVTTEVDMVKDQIAQFEITRDSAQDLQKRLSAARQLLGDHVYWTAFFAQLEKYTVADVYYVNFSMSGQSMLTISAVAKDYETVARQLVAFQNANDFVRDVEIDAASAQLLEDEETGDLVLGGIDFTINLDFIPGIFNKPLSL